MDLAVQERIVRHAIFGATMGDREIARQSIDLQNRGRDYALIEIPAYKAWSSRKLKENENEFATLIGHMDAMSMFLLPEEVSTVTDAELDDLLEQVRDEIE